MSLQEKDHKLVFALESLVEHADRACQKEAETNLLVVNLEKTASESRLGLDVEDVDGKTLKVVLVKPGLAKIYNSTVDESMQIKAGDRIIDVNGTHGNYERMASHIRQTQKLRFVIKRGINGLMRKSDNLSLAVLRSLGAKSVSKRMRKTLDFPLSRSEKMERLIWVYHDQVDTDLTRAAK